VCVEKCLWEVRTKRNENGGDENRKKICLSKSHYLLKEQKDRKTDNNCVNKCYWLLKL
jgi:hypothetical protein